MDPNEAQPTPEAPPPTRLPSRRTAGCLVITGLLLAALVVALFMLVSRRPRLTVEDARGIVSATLQRESRQAFLVTGALDLAVTTRVRNTKRLLPGIVDLSLGSAESTVRVPGRASYGIRVSDVGTGDIRVRGDTIDIRLPDPVLYSLEPYLDRMETRTDAGWLRLRGDARQEVQEHAISLVRSTMKAQAEQHLRTAEQPRINTAETLHEMLLPAFRSAGIERPVFRFRISERLNYTTDREPRGR